MTREKLEKLVNKLKNLSDRNKELYKLDIDLVNFEDPFYSVIELLLKEIFNEEQMGWFDWFCFENDYGRASLVARDKDGNLICQDIDGLYKLLNEK